MLKHFSAKNICPHLLQLGFMSIVCDYTRASYCDLYSLIEGNITQDKYAQKINKKLALDPFRQPIFFFFFPTAVKEITATRNTELSCLGTCIH